MGSDLSQTFESCHNTIHLLSLGISKWMAIEIKGSDKKVMEFE